MSIINQIEINGTTYDLPSGGVGSAEFYRWDFREGTIYPCSYFDATNKAIVEGGQGQYTALHYTFDGTEERVRISATTGGSNRRPGYCFLDGDGNILLIPSFISGENFRDYEIVVPEGATDLWLNGSNYVSVHLEVSQKDLRANYYTLDKLLKDYAKKISYHDNFAWKPMPTGLIAFTFDDSLDDIGAVTDLFIEKNVPCCYGAIPEKLNMGITSSVGEETVGQAMMRGVNTVGCEVLSHGSSATEIVTEDNIDDMNFLYNKFAINRRKFEDYGFKVRGCVRVGGSGNITHDVRTDVWQRLFFDYGDAYGISEPYNHPRFSGSTTAQYYAEIDDAILDKRFTALLFHGADMEELPDMIDYVIAHGGQIVNYATAYDTYGSTVNEVAMLNRISALENSDANQEEY